jgi:hypothetical protein
MNKRALWLLLLLLPLAKANAGGDGYLPDAVCANCHGELFASFQEVGMARSLSSPGRAAPLEDFGAAPYFHAPSGRYYQMAKNGDAMVFRRWRQDETGRRIDQLELPVAWVLGSGHTSRVYLYGTPSGELFQLPLAWYSQENAWAMAPGYDRPDHEEVSRRIRRECMFCHNAYPPPEPDGSRFAAIPTFPRTLPEGIGCQRCHGPGAEHVELVTGGEARPAEIAKSIVNPAKLPPERGREVCYQCHLQPSVSLIGVRRFGREDYSFRPGERLADYLVAVDPKQAGQERSERFEINHHPYRLEQSACFKKSAGALSCLTCHDPHRKVPAASRPAHYRAACLSCHQDPAACKRGPEWATDARAAVEDCAGCHMSRRRTQDVVHVAMTDHLIARKPGGAELLAPLAERDPELEGLGIHPLEGAPQGRLAEIYRALAVLRMVPSADALSFLEKALPQENPAQPDAWLDLAGALLRRKKMPEAIAALDRFGRGSDLEAQWRALAQTSGREMEARLRRAVERYPNNPELLYNLGRVLRDRDPAAAEPLLARAVELRPNLAGAWYQLGVARAALGKKAEAVESWQRALAFDPGHRESREALAAASGKVAQ